MIGTVLLETTSTLLQSWLGSSIGGVQLTVYSLILMAVILWRPTGLIGMISEAYQRVIAAASRRERKAHSMADALVIQRPQQAVRRTARRAGRQLYRSRKTKPSR